MRGNDYYKGKRDEVKLPMRLVPPGINEAIALVRAYGMMKYKTADGWREVPDAVYRYWDAMERHLSACKREGNFSRDIESGLPHLFQAACNLAFLIELCYGRDFDGTVLPFYTKEQWAKLADMYAEKTNKAKE